MTLVLSPKWQSDLLVDPISSGGFKGGANEPPFGLDLVQRSAGDRLNGTPLSV